MYTLSLEIINKCNLNCTYCYLGEKKNTYMSKETAEKAIEIAVHEAKKQYDKMLLIYFIGGEPLMAFEIIQDIVRFVEKKCEKQGIKCVFSTTTNGTLVTHEIVDFFIYYQFGIKVSLDGNVLVHDMNRKYYTKSGSFQKIIENLDYFRRYERVTGRKLSFAHVITKNNYKYFQESFKFLLDLGCEKIETGIDHYCTWGDEELYELKCQLTKVFYIYKEAVKKNRRSLYWNIFEQQLEAYLIPCDFYACKAGVNNIFVTSDGNIYTCIELPQFQIGSVETGLDVRRIREIAYGKDIQHRNCGNCNYIKNCRTRGCLASNYEVHQNFYHPVEVNCTITKVIYELIEQNFTEAQLDKARLEYLRRRDYERSKFAQF